MTQLLLATESSLETLTQVAPPSGLRIEVLFVLILAAGAIVLWVGSILLDRWGAWRGRSSNTPQALFRELCAAHDLNRSECRLMMSAAARLPGDTLCRVFIDRQHLERLAQPGSSDAEAYAELARKLFA